MNPEPSHNPPGQALPSPAWGALVERIRTGEPSAVEELYGIFVRSVRFFLWRQLGPQDLDDRVHDIFLMVMQSIQRGELRDPERLMGYVRTVVRRQAATYIQGAMHARRSQVMIDSGNVLSAREPNPEHRAIEAQTTQVARRVLQSLPWRDREVLIRFYLQEQPPHQICRDLEITETQFRLIKSRAKSRYSDLARRRFARRNGFRP